MASTKIDYAKGLAKNKSKGKAKKPTSDRRPISDPGRSTKGAKPKPTSKGKGIDYASGLNPALGGGRTAGNPGGGNKGGGGGGKKGSGFGGGGSLLAPFSSNNEKAGLTATTKSLTEAEKRSKNELDRGFDSAKAQYGKGIDAVNQGVATARGDIAGSTGKALSRIDTAGATARGDIAGYNAHARDVLAAGGTQARTDISTGARGGEEAILGGAGGAINSLTAGHDASRGDITTGRDAALGGYAPYVANTAGASRSYADALGLNGPEGNTRAVSQFRADPGYQFALNQGLDAVDRRASSRGELGSGGNTIDTLNYAHGLSDQEYGKYLDRLFGQQGVGLQVAGATGDINTNAGTQLAGLDTGYGQDVGNVMTGAGNNIAAIRGAEGTALGGVATGTAGDIAGNLSGTGSSLATSGMNTGTAGADVITGGGTSLANTTMSGAGSLLNTYGTLGDRRYDYATDLARLKYGTTTGIGAARAGFQQSKDTTGGNIWGGILGAGQLGASMFPKLGTRQASTNAVNGPM